MELVAEEKLSEMLIKYAEVGDLEYVRKCLKEGPYDNFAKGRNGETALLLAAENGHTDIVCELIKHGADPNFGDNSGKLAIHCASENGHRNIVLELLSNGADSNLADTLKRRAIDFAAERGHTDIVSDLINRAKPSIINTKTATKAVRYAAKGGHKEIVLKLIDEGANINMPDQLGKTPLHYAAENEHANIVSGLLDRGAYPNVADIFGKTPLHYAAGNEHPNIVSELLDTGGNLNVKDIFGQTPLHYAIIYNQDLVVSELLNRESDPSVVDHHGMTHLHYAAMYENTFAVSELIKRGLNPNITDKNGQIPLHCAAQMNETTEVVVELLNRGSSLEFGDKDGKTALHCAAMKGSLNIVSELLKRGLDPNVTDNNGSTPLEYAAREGHTITVRQLIDSGSDPNRLFENQKSTPPEYAANEKHSFTFRRFIESGFDTKRLFENKNTWKRRAESRMIWIKKILAEAKQKVEEQLRALGLENVIDLPEVLHENYQKCFWNRVYLVGPYSVGKSCLAKILVGEPVPIVRQSTDGIWIYRGKAGMNIDTMEWVFFPKGNAITEILTNMLMSMSTNKKANSIKDNLDDVTQIETMSTVKRSTISFKEESETVKLSGNSKPADQIDDNTSSECDFETLRNQNDQGASEIKITKEKKQRILIVSDDSASEWRNQITSDMSPDKIHELIVKAVKDGKYKQMVVPIDIWDFGGQKDYYMTHQLFITSRGIFVLMFNGSVDLNKHMPDLSFLPGHFGKPTVAVYLLHWVNSILTYCKRTVAGFPRIIFVATHKDGKWFQWTQEARRNQLEDELQQLFETHSGLKHLEFKPLIFVDATNPDDPEIADLREKLMQRATEHPRWGEPMPTRWIPLELQLSQKSAEGINIISRDQLLALNSKNESMVLSDMQIETFLKVQHSLGKLLYFDLENLRHCIIISPAYLVEVLRSIVREMQFWPKGQMFSRILSNLQETGMIERNDIYCLWEQDEFNQIMPYKEYMIQILVHLDVIIAPRTSFEGVNISINDVSRFMVPCMVTKCNDTMYLKKFRNSNNSIMLAFSFTEQVIPPALSYRFLSSLITSWDIKNYKGRNREKRMFFSDLAIVTIDSSHDVAVQVETNRVIVSLIHARTKEDIIPTLASSLQECLTAAIIRISEFYSVLSEDIKPKKAGTVLPFNIEFGVFCKSKMCFFDHNEMSLSTDEAVWICKKHKQRHATKYLSAWFSSKEPCNVCQISCEGLGRLESEQCPLPQHIMRLAARLSTVEIREIAILLGFQAEEWNDLEHQFQHQTSNDLKFMALWSSILKRKNCSFHDMKNVLEEKGLSTHLLCQVFRDVVIDVSDMTNEKLNKIPSIDALHDLSNHIGNSMMQLAIELEVDVSYLQQIQHDLKNKLLEQNRNIFIKWRQNKFPKPTVLRLLKALYRVGKFGPTFKVLKNHLE